MTAISFGVETPAEDSVLDYRGRLLVEVLREFGQDGLDLIFSSAVVDEKLRVTIEPRSRKPRAILDEILEPLGLIARDGPAGSILILERDGPRDSGQPATAALRSELVTEIVVTPGRHSVISDGEAQRLSVMRDDSVLVPTIGGDISRVVELLPGVAAADNSAAFNVRGGTSQDVSMVLDGLELYDPFHLQSFQSPFTLIDTKIVDRIDLFAGGFTADLGDRHGGFVEISTVAPQGSGRGEIELGSLNSRVSYQAPMSGASGSWLLSIRGWYPGALRKTTELGGGERTDPRFWDAYAKASFSVSPRTLVSIHGLVSHDRLKFSEKPDPDGDQLESAFALTRSGYIWVRALNSFSSVTSESMLSRGRIERDRLGVSKPQEASFDVDDRRTVDFFGFKNDSVWRISDSHVLKAGVDLRYLEAGYRYDLVPLDPPDPARSFRLDPHGTSLGGYAAYRARVSPSLTTEVGVRWDRQTHTRDNQLSPRLNAFWRVGPRSEFRLGLGRFNQSQRIHELQVPDGQTDFVAAEDSEQAEFTFQHRFRGGIRFRADAYYRELSSMHPRYENLFEPIELFPETGIDRVLVDPARARLRGAEFFLRGDSGRPLTWWVSYALSSAEDRIDGIDVPRNWDQPHALKFLLGYSAGERWSLSLSGSARSGWPTTPPVGFTTDPGGSFDPILGPRNSDRFETYRRLDAKLRRSVSIGHGRLWFSMDMVNLTDRHNAWGVDEFVLVPLPGGGTTVGRELDFWLGFTPFFSVVWEF